MQVSMPFLNDTRCVQRYNLVNPQLQVCAGEIGQNKDTCQVINNLFVYSLFNNFKTLNFYSKGW